jgi:hypothetical protein
MRKRDERFAEQSKHKGKPDPLHDKTVTGAGEPVGRFGPKDFRFNDDNTATCPAGRLMTSSGSIYTTATRLH